MNKVKENIDETPIYGKYHCFNCHTEMRPIKRISYTTTFGVRHLHICPKCGELLIESESAKHITKIWGRIEL